MSFMWCAEEKQGVLFDIMAGLERLVNTFFGSNRILSRYLTLFYSITLGLAVALAFFSIYHHEIDTSGTISTTATQVILSQAKTPPPGSTQVQARNAPTLLPAIPPTPNEKTPSALGVTADQLRGVQVNLWHPWTGANGAALQSILEEFNLTNQWGITVQASPYEGFGRLDEAMESALLADLQPDVIVDYGYQARHWDGVDALVDLTPYVNDPVWGMTSDEQADFYPSFWAEDLVTTTAAGQARRLGIPYYRSAYVLYYNQSFAHELGYPKPPISAEDFRVRACAAAQFINKEGDKSNLGMGGWLITPQPGGLVGWIYAFDGGITNPGSAGYLFSTPDTLQAFRYLKGLQESGCAWLGTSVDAQSEFANRHALFIVGSLFDIPAQQEAFLQAGSTDEWVVLPFPSSSHPVVDTYGPSILITRSNPTQQLAAWLVTKWLVYPLNQSDWAQALETYPTRLSSLGYMNGSTNNSPQWMQALDLIPDAHSEPSLASWSMMRWALEDVIAQLFNPQFTADQIPSLLEKLDDVAAEIYSQVQ
jgi:multiple sugar transport system substrate-binding protein